VVKSLTSVSPTKHQIAQAIAVEVAAEWRSRITWRDPRSNPISLWLARERTIAFAQVDPERTVPHTDDVTEAVPMTSMMIRMPPNQPKPWPPNHHHQLCW